MRCSEILKKYQDSNIEQISNQTGDIVASELVFLSANLWQAGSLVLEAEVKMSKIWLDIRALAQSDKQADQQIKLQPEYKEFMEAKCAEKSVVSLIQSLKKLLHSKADEYKAYQ